MTGLTGPPGFGLCTHYRSPRDVSGSASPGTRGKVTHVAVGTGPFKASSCFMFSPAACSAILKRELHLESHLLLSIA